MNARDLPSALESLDQIGETIGRRLPAFFLDFDGTLAPLVPRPELAELTGEVRDLLTRLAERRHVTVVSGRSLDDLRDRIGLDHLYYAADHGHRISGPPGSQIDFRVGPEDPEEPRRAAEELERGLGDAPGVVIENKEVSVAVHYRLVAEEQRSIVREVVEGVARSFPGLRLTEGKLVYELVPAVIWHKGRAVLWLLDYLRSGGADPCPVCLGDDLTDEDMFLATKATGVTVIVGDPERASAASYRLGEPAEVVRFLATFVPETGREHSV
jgi:trehalose-phosphatase